LWERQQVTAYPDLRDPRVTLNFTCHKIAISMGKDEAEDQALESFVEILHVTSWVRFFKPKSVNNKEVGEVLEQR
jgi:hypothetical protein